MRITKIATTIAISAALVLAGCTGPAEEPIEAPEDEVTTGAPSDDGNGEQDDPKQGDGENGDEDEDAETPDAVAGDAVTEEEAELLPDGQTGYELDDGTLVVVDVNEELPQVLVEELDSLHNDVPQTQGPQEDQSTGKVVTKMHDVALNTKRQTVVVALGGSYSNGELVDTFWTVNATGQASEVLRRDISKYRRETGTQEQSIAYAEWLLGEVDDPESYQVIVIDR